MCNTIMLGTCLLLSSLLTGCSLFVDVFSDEEDPPSWENFSIETEQAVYLVEEGQLLTITYAYVNEGKDAFYPGLCLEFPSGVLEKLVDGEWVFAHVPTCADILTDPTKVEAGTRYLVTIQLTPSTWDPVRPSSAWRGGDIEGTYRVYERVYGDWGMEKFDEGTLPSEIVVSNPFEIRRQL